MMNEAVNTIMSTQLITVRPTDSLRHVRQIFMQHAIHHLPVVSSGKLVGILTTYDLWKNEIAPEDYNQVMAMEVMTKKMAKISTNDKIGTAAEIFLDNRFHALPVVDEENHLLGIVTSHDVLQYEYLKAYPRPILFRNLAERKRRSA